MKSTDYAYLTKLRFTVPYTRCRSEFRHGFGRAGGCREGIYMVLPVKTKGDEMEMDRLLTVQETAKILGMAVQTIYNRICQGQPLPQYVKIGHRTRFPESAVKAWIEGLKQQAAEARPARLPDPAPKRRKRADLDDARRAWVEAWKQAAERAAEEAAGLAPRRRGRPTKAELIARREAGLALARAQGLLPQQ